MGRRGNPFQIADPKASMPPADTNLARSRGVSGFGGGVPVPSPSPKRDPEAALGMRPVKQVRREDPIVDRSARVTLGDLGGVDRIREEINRWRLHWKNKDIFRLIGGEDVTPPRGILLHGPPGSGKTKLAHAIAGEFDVPLLKIAAPEVVSGISGDSERTLKDIFDKAEKYAPCVLFIDEIDAITQKRESTSTDMGRRIVAQLITCFDALNGKPHLDVFVIGATSSPSDLDQRLRLHDRFGKEIALGIPNESARLQILTVICKEMKLSSEVDLKSIAHKTPGYVAADLKSLVAEAKISAVDRYLSPPKAHTVSQPVSSPATEENGAQGPFEPTSVEPIQPVVGSIESPAPKTTVPSVVSNGDIAMESHSDAAITAGDFEISLKRIVPCAKREGFATIPNVCWDDVGALGDIREELEMTILDCVRDPAEYEEFGIENPPGILLCGPPGCGKTLLAKAIANESGLNFISVKGPELINMYLGESEAGVRKVFARARNSAPCVVFFDEIDALCPRRSDSGDNNAVSRVVNQFLTELDGVEEKSQVFVVGATNRPDMLDPAMLRPGRLDKILFVDLPEESARVQILHAVTKNRTKPPVDADVDFLEVARLTDRFSGADLAALVKQAAAIVLRERSTLQREKPEMKRSEIEALNDRVKRRHIDAALRKVKPSVTPEAYHSYKALKERLKGTASDSL